MLGFVLFIPVFLLNLQPSDGSRAPYNPSDRSVSITTDDSSDLSDDTLLRTLNVPEVLKLVREAKDEQSDSQKNVHRVSSYRNRKHPNKKPIHILKSRAVENLESILQKSRLNSYVNNHNRVPKNDISTDYGSDDSLYERLKEQGNSHGDNYNFKKQLGGLNKYSKIYLVLQPSALQSSKDIDRLNSLISTLKSETSKAQQRDAGYNFKARRFQEKDSFVSASMEDVKPKRSKIDYGGGGGVPGGRTPIPYIRNRGDIYEKD